jgi:epoxyqueuosine reductase
LAPPDASALLSWFGDAAREQGFAAFGIASVQLADEVAHLDRWLAAGNHGEMHYLAAHRELRAQPEGLLPGVVRVISLRMPYRPVAADAETVLADGQRAYISRYALGRDYHKLIRKRLVRLAEALAEQVGPMGYRVCCDSAPVLEKALARDAGLGWIGKNTLLLTREAGSWFFLGEILTDAPLPVTPAPSDRHPGCGGCQACLRICPTQAFTGPWQLDARRCISYLTIEQRGPIPEALRPLIGNRIFGCDDCQLVCPWNRHAQPSEEAAFAPRHGLDQARLVELWAWTEAEWRQRTEGMALRRAGWSGWRRNLAVAMGNAPADSAIQAALRDAHATADALVAEHIAWALERQSRAQPAASADDTGGNSATAAVRPG